MDPAIAALAGALIGTSGSLAVGLIQARSARVTALEVSEQETERQMRGPREEVYGALIDAGTEARDYFKRRAVFDTYDVESDPAGAMVMFAQGQWERCEAVALAHRQCVLRGPAAVADAARQLSEANGRFAAVMTACYEMAFEHDAAPTVETWEEADAAHRDFTAAFALFEQEAEAALNPLPRATRRRRSIVR